MIAYCRDARYRGLFYTNKIDFGSGPSNIKCLVALTIQKINHETLKSVDFLQQVSEATMATLIPHYLLERRRTFKLTRFSLALYTR